MAVTPEGRVKKAVRKLLDEHGAYFFMPVQTGYGATTLDFLCCCYGQFVAIETKAPGKKMTERQTLVGSQILGAGGIVMMVDNADDLSHLRDLLEELRGRK
jgi:hypothetical protein